MVQLWLTHMEATTVDMEVTMVVTTEAITEAMQATLDMVMVGM